MFPQSYEKAFEWHKKGAEQGGVDAQLHLASMFEDGRGVEVDDRKAVEWYQKAAEQGHAIAQFSMGFRYGSGKGVEKDDRKAVKWYRMAVHSPLELREYRQFLEDDGFIVL